MFVLTSVVKIIKNRCAKWNNISLCAPIFLSTLGLQHLLVYIYTFLEKWCAEEDFPLKLSSDKLAHLYTYIMFQPMLLLCYANMLYSCDADDPLQSFVLGFMLPWKCRIVGNYSICIIIM